MNESFLSHAPLEKEIRATRVQENESAASRCFINLDSSQTKSKKVIEYRVKMPTEEDSEDLNRLLSIYEDGKIELSGYDPSVELIEDEGSLNYSTTLDSTDLLEEITRDFAELEENAASEDYQVFDQLLGSVEREAELYL